MTNFKKVNPKQSFPELEEAILDFWKKDNTFQKSIDNRADAEEFNFYDGPPFATGTPHYGHILAGTIKDVIPRYQTMKGKKVDRKFGWDTHGLPIENIVEKKLDIKGKEDLEQRIGVHKFNETCRENVFGYVDEWEKIVARMGRWVDMENDYKTMDTDFMESVWWVFSEMYKKGLIYEGHRVVPYSVGMSTPLSNFEVNQGYKDKQDKTVTVKFKVIGSENKYILAWTTTPWTLVANLGLAVGKDIDYVEVLDESGETYILAKDRLSDYYKNKEDYTLVREYKGSCLVGIKYEPLFPDFKEQIEAGIDLGNEIYLGKNAYSVVEGHHVTTESGTGIVHIAPAYGEDDYQIGKEKDLGFVTHINDSGKTENLLEDNGIWVFDYNEMALEELKKQGSVVKISTINHSYPHCWRSGVPLIYKAISAWYVDVTKIKNEIIKSNQNIKWVPGDIKNGRMGKWLEGARDWNISRNRYWGSAIPVWQSEDKQKQVVIGSIEELYQANKDYGQIEKKDSKYFYTNTGKEIDLHKHFVDEIFVKDPESGEKLKRIPEVLDCWFESGSMPYASKHYMGDERLSEDNKQKISDDNLSLSSEITGKKSSDNSLLSSEIIGKKSSDNPSFKFPADFIAEGLDQTRGWFYTLIIIGTALFGVAPMKNIIVNGIILAEDGKKMSKSLKNYPDPNHIFNTYGADAMRFYLLNSPVVEAQDFRFAESGVEEVVKKVILPLWNTYYFFTTYANIDNFEPRKGESYFVRHGETDNNKFKRVNGGESDTDINETGIKQAHETGKKLKEMGVKFDKIITSPMLRAKHTAEIINSYIGNIETEVEEDLKELNYGEFGGKDFKEISEKYNIENDEDKIREYVFENSPEGIEKYIKRTKKVLLKIKSENAGKNILIVAHSGTYRAITQQNNPKLGVKNFLKIPTLHNAEISNINEQKSNILDRWLLSELNELTKEVRIAFDNYELNKATKPIFKFMDNLTNWYIRRSRKRFWKSENDGDKIEAYETLYFTLVELTKIIAPFMPFISDYIYRELVRDEKTSVHLQNFPAYDESIIDLKLNSDTDRIQKIITLGLAFRANRKIRVRQPLSSLTVTEKFSNFYEEILKEELNVKEIIVVKGESLAKKICKPNGRAIGPKFGKDVKFIMTEAKAGNFEELKDGSVKVGDFTLEKGDFELEYIKADENAEIEADFGMVISMDTKITPELEKEGFARDIVRHIQEARKEAGYNVEDRIGVELRSENGELRETIKDFKDYIEKETLSNYGNLTNSDLEKEVEIEGEKVEIKLKK